MSSTADIGPITATIECPSRDDGYKPICDPIWVWGRILGFPSLEEYRMLSSAARRLDSGHLQIERVREGIATMPPLESPAGRWRMHEVIGDAELGIIALDKALDIIINKLPGSFRVKLPIPQLVRAKWPLVGRLRDHYSHIDERALGKVWGKASPEAEKAWAFAALFEDRELTDGTESLSIDNEATELCVAARGYLVAAWQQLVERGRAAQSEGGTPQSAEPTETGSGAELS
jgi:hypothetical protein